MLPASGVEAAFTTDASGLALPRSAPAVSRYDQLGVVPRTEPMPLKPSEIELSTYRLPLARTVRTPGIVATVLPVGSVLKRTLEKSQLSAGFFGLVPTCRSP